MSNPKWGTKRQCQECGERFYDLKKTKIVCPHCDAPFKLDAQSKAKRAIPTPEKAEMPQPAAENLIAKPGAAAESDEDKALKELKVDIPEDTSLDENEDKDKNAFEDVSELGEDEDDMAEVIDGSRKIDET